MLSSVRLGMGVNHGEGTEGGGATSPLPEFGMSETIMQIVPPPDFVMFQNFKHQIAALQYSEM